jgi:predicted  nucleic acid-binding Zn-ribbon protein
LIAELRILLAEERTKRERAEADLAAANKRVPYWADPALLFQRKFNTAQQRIATLEAALRMAREYVKATEGQLVTRPNIVTKDREMCDAAPGEPKP